MGLELAEMRDTGSPCFDMTIKHVKEEAALSLFSCYSSAFSNEVRFNISLKGEHI